MFLGIDCMQLWHLKHTLVLVIVNYVVSNKDENQ